MVSAPQHALLELTHLAATLATEVGQVVDQMRTAGVRIATTKTRRTDVVTAADQEAERLILAGLRAARPDDGVLGEEGSSVEGSTGISWGVDPIDGTVNYLYGLPGYAVSIAATVANGTAGSGADSGANTAMGRGSPAAGNMADGRRAIAGAVYLPVTGELFTAHEGGGAQLNGEPLAPLEETQLSVALVGTGFGYTTERRTEQAAVVRQIIPQVRDIRRMGSAAIDLCMLAAGRLDAYYERGLQPWDYAAAALIARESGATVLGLHADTLPGEPMLIAGPSQLAHELQSAVREAYREVGPERRR